MANLSFRMRSCDQAPVATVDAPALHERFEHGWLDTGSRTPIHKVRPALLVPLDGPLDGHVGILFLSSSNASALGRIPEVFKRGSDLRWRSRLQYLPAGPQVCVLTTEELESAVRAGLVGPWSDAFVESEDGLALVARLLDAVEQKAWRHDRCTTFEVPQ